jgi:uncharacterized protein GlcG (DUF336 family)
MSITLIQAQKIAEAAKSKADEIGVAMNIAVVDESANMKWFIRMDNAILASVDISIKKARTSCLCGMDSGEVGKLSQPGGPLYNIELTNGGLVTFPGGLLLRDSEGKITGAIGVSGGEVHEDYAVASAGAAVFKA